MATETPAAPEGRTTPAPRRPRVGRLDRSALAGVLVREVVNFSSYWRSTAFSSTVEPAIYLLAFGFGFGTLVATIDGLDYVEFVGTGTVATAVMFSSVFPAMFGTFVKREFQRTYDAILAAPVDSEEIVTGEALWIATRAGTFGCVPLLVSMAFGLDPSWGMLLVPFVAFLTGFGFASLGILIAAVLKSIDNFNYVTSILLTPLMLVAGTYFPIDRLPEWAQVAANFNPLYHLVEIVRHAVFGFEAIDLFHLAVIVVFGLIAWRLAVGRMEKRLIQ
jgi:lipooligosaccharide transport system permease protein